MTAEEAYHVNRVWADLVVAGRQAQIDQLLTEIDRLLPKEWERKVEAEQQSYEILQRQGWAGPPSHCYSHALPNSEVRLWLNRLSAYRVHGGLVESNRLGRYLADNAESIRDFRHHILDPATELCGLTISRSGLGPLSWVTAEVLNRLWAFFDSSGFRWPPTGDAFRRWREFVLSAYQNHAAFDRGEFSVWLRDKGWAETDAESLITQLYSEAASLSVEDEFRQPV